MSDSSQLSNFNPTATGGSVSFLSLPGELRNTIYEIILLQSEPIDPWLRYGLQVPTGLFCVSKTVHREASLLFYSQNRLDFGGRDPEKLASFLKQIGPRNAKSIQHIIIDFPEFLYLDPGDVTIEEKSLSILGSIMSSCTGLITLKTSLYSTSSMELRLDNLDHFNLATEALHLVDTHFRAMPSLSEIILEPYYTQIQLQPRRPGQQDTMLATLGLRAPEQVIVVLAGCYPPHEAFGMQIPF
ncbi:hypothetical protein FPRO04_14234 [Fusarium proliferatum]|nr:hypothetical protein FPRO04_14234 [Fusarium proliferatum]